MPLSGDAKVREVRCPGCGQLWPMLQCLMGVLGSRRHYRCRGCGMEWSTLSKRKAHR